MVTVNRIQLVPGTSSTRSVLDFVLNLSNLNSQERHPLLLALESYLPVVYCFTHRHVLSTIVRITQRTSTSARDVVARTTWYDGTST
jgi:hypothetical protein